MRQEARRTPRTDLLNMIHADNETLCLGIGFRVLMNTVSHPIEYAKVLIQIGYEPFPPRETVTWFRRPALGLPNVFEYIRHIYAVDGLSGCYRGLVPKLCACTLNTIAFEKPLTYIAKLTIWDEDNSNEAEAQTEEDVSEPKYKQTLIELLQHLISRTFGIIVSHPLDVVTIRMMAQFVGRETKYNGLFGSFTEIYKQNGIMGFYAGLVPRLLGNAATLILVGTSTYLINKYFIHDGEMRAYTASTMKFVATTITYPFLVVSNCMAVNNSGLVVGLPPQMPIYDNWIDCWHHLAANNQLKRGSSLLWRYYTGPQVIVNGRPIALNLDMYLQKKKGL